MKTQEPNTAWLKPLTVEQLSEIDTLRNQQEKQKIETTKQFNYVVSDINDLLIYAFHVLPIGGDETSYVAIGRIFNEYNLCYKMVRDSFLEGGIDIVIYEGVVRAKRTR